MQQKLYVFVWKYLYISKTLQITCNDTFNSPISKFGAKSHLCCQLYSAHKMKENLNAQVLIKSYKIANCTLWVKIYVQKKP